MEEDQRVFSAYQDCIQLQLQLNLAHHAVQRLRVSLGASRKSFSTSGAQEAQELVHNSSTEQLRTIIRYLLDTLLSLLHSNNGELHYTQNDMQQMTWFQLVGSRANILPNIVNYWILHVSVCFQDTPCPPCSRVLFMPRPVRSSLNTFASVGHLRSVSTPACCWCSFVEVSAGGASSSQTCCRSSTTLSNCSSFLRTGTVSTHYTCSN